MDSSYDFERMSILLVDGNAHMRAIVSSILQGFGIGEIVPASDTSFALQVLKEKPIDLVICEYNLSPLDGIEFTKIVRTGKDSPNPSVPVLMLTAHSEFDKVKSAQDAGITDFMTKPVSPTELYKHLVRSIENSRQFV